MEIRTAQLADVPALEPLFEQWGHPLPPEDLRDHVCRWRDAPGAEFSVALVHGELAGMAAIAVVPHLGRPGCAAKLVGLAVVERHRRKGVGRALLDHATGRALAWGCDQIELTSSRARDAAHAFYVALGYRDTSADHARYVRSLRADEGS